MKKLAIMMGAAALLFATSAQAVIINISATSNTVPPGTNLIELALGPGDYSIEVIGTAEGGAYNAWSAWNEPHTCAIDPGVCNPGPGVTGWLNSYAFASPGGGIAATPVGDGLVYNNPGLANAAAIDSSFSLANAATVSFYITDFPVTDNSGGISLNVTQVPEPLSVLMLGVALVGLASGRRRFRAA